ncbi:LHPL2-like protein [Mya arenaria]|uniref:LHPL2-like protein n=1 Tax=Mya arenaria TaxID=6604 RepID=A0ABY7G4Z1_MYAAR|nr:LHFPL tetraspan subfamily member 2a protein-like [Mya arenaria]XP_052786940.1 LHFPL tetraspan subfamily member 2a protein-like [Mya arenaria]XP_052786941.1 LHFPL tetraspan subfamily member 2a protein-like [Mya arenaria]XP_052786942.1 LHFPL tetraspan subfamily member 2a protein-like [Mya arenaria]XP_052786943.1 LHFPL tetraspan subfamily member 2a protein-like [Mya arenaria]WAR29510.1 LHPL2-like protein [Mya arenaria]
MCQVIVTCRSFLWTLLSIATTQIFIASVFSPAWLIGYERSPQALTFNNLGNSSTWEGRYDNNEDATEPFSPTIGIINRCTRLRRFQEILKRENCATYVTEFSMPNSQFPDAWKASLVFFCIGGVLLVFTMGTSVMSICMQSMCGKSIFTLSGLIQSIAGVFCSIGVVLYPVGWSSDKVKFYCGEETSAFHYDLCSFGWSFYACVAAVILVFTCSVLSIGADHATTSRRVEEELVEGKALICVMA